MRMRIPTSKSSFQLRLSPVDVLWASIAPAFALLLRDPSAFTDWSPDSNWSLDRLAVLWTLLIAFSLFSFLVFRIRDGFTAHFSVYDALGVAKAVVLTECFTIVALFTLTRLESIPRSIPIIHGLLLAAGLVAARAIFRLVQQDNSVGGAQPRTQEGIIFIGATRLTALFIQMLAACSPKNSKVMGVLDTDPSTLGQMISNIRVIGSPEQLEPILEEFLEHGIRVDRVLVGHRQTSLPSAAVADIQAICNRREINLAYIPDIVGVFDEEETKPSWELAADNTILSPYFAVKRFVEPLIALMLMLVASPLFFIVGTLIIIDLGLPILFWQSRIGRNAQPFLLHKFRTMKPIVDDSGLTISHVERASVVGNFLRRMHLDELPQLLNVLVGDMSLVGPRPLLPNDQPAGTSLRLTVKPGMTGWAQVNGGKLLNSAEKNTLDEWYVRNASFWLDLKILLMTVGVLFRRKAGSPAQDQQPVPTTPQNTKGLRSRT